MKYKRTVIVIVARRLDNAKSGNSVYLKAFLKLARDTGYQTKVIFAPSRSLGNLAWARLHADFVPLFDQIDWPGTVRVYGTYISTDLRVWSRFLWRIGYMISRRLAGSHHSKPHSLLGYELDRWEDAALGRHLADRPTDLAVAEYSAVAPVLRHVSATSKAVLLHDLFSLRAASFKRAGKLPDHIDISIQDEAIRLRHADTLLHASVSELSAMKAHLPETRHVWMQPMVSEPETFNPRLGPPRAVFFGVRHGGNMAALNLLLEEIWPRVRQQTQEFELWIVGSVGTFVPEDIRHGHGIRVLGIVEDLTEIGGAQSVGLAPTALESGVSIKVLEYMALRMPALVLPNALNGYGTMLDETVVRAETVDDYVSKLVDLLKDGEERQKITETAIIRLPEFTSNDALKRFLQDLSGVSPVSRTPCE